MDRISEMKITFSDALCVIRRKMIDEWQEQYQHSSMFKGTAHFKIQRKISTKPWFNGIVMNGTDIKILTRLRTDCLDLN